MPISLEAHAGVAARHHAIEVCGLPRALLGSPPPDEAHRRGALLFAENALHIGQERRLIRVVSPPLVTHQKSLGWLVAERNRCLLPAPG